jgi:hypothetical protein
MTTYYDNKNIKISPLNPSVCEIKRRHISNRRKARGVWKKTLLKNHVRYLRKLVETGVLTYAIV